MELTCGKREIGDAGYRRNNFRSQVGTESESDCLLGQLNRMLEISDSGGCLNEEIFGGR